MELYEKELRALKRAGRYRERKVLDPTLLDFASNDYLSLAHNKEIYKQTVYELQQYEAHSPKASMLVNGYHQIHKDFEAELCRLNGFEDGVVMGSGFNANIALIEALVRRDDILIMDEKYHASGVLASQIGEKQVVMFTHNNMQKLEESLKQHDKEKKRIIVAVEGIYSMDGDLLDAEVFSLCDRYNAILLVDEAHSSGVVGPHLMGVYDLYNITIKPNHIKMGTLGKAYGSFGAYILASSHIIEYLLNRAKPLIYATSLSLFDTLLAHNALRYIEQNTLQLQEEIQKIKTLLSEEMEIESESLIYPIVINDNKRVMAIKKRMEESGFLVGAIRQPTVPEAIIRLIARVGYTQEQLKELCTTLKELIVESKNES